MTHTIASYSHNLVIIPEPTTPIILHQAWRRFHKPSISPVSEQQKQQQLTHAISEIVATFYSEKGYMLTMRRVHRKMLHLASGGVVEGFVTAYDKHFASVTTDAFTATLKVVEVYVRNYLDNRNYQLKKCWQVVPMAKPTNKDAVCRT